MINRKEFYSCIRKSFGSLSQGQVDGFELIFKEWEDKKLTDLRWLAYMLATVWHECATTMQPIREVGKGKNRKYGSRIKHSGVTYSPIYGIMYGRGYVQLTWFENYELMGRLLGIDLLKKPDLALVPEIAVKILFEGMLRGSSSVGDFTGKCLEQYFNSETNDPLGARKIINGTDKAKEIKVFHDIFFSGLKII